MRLAVFATAFAKCADQAKPELYEAAARFDWTGTPAERCFIFDVKENRSCPTNCEIR